ncbi:MAG: BatA domain-containing protein [Planctomycetota bacterium]
MSFLTPALTAGALLIALPIVLHLVMRRQPEPLVFPALRFVRNRKSSNQTRMRLRHWGLLALRCVAVALLALALARPVLKGSGLKGGETGVVSVALVVDNSPRMQLRERDETRLEAAKELGGWLLEQLPSDSRVGVLGRGSVRGKRLTDRDAAQLRLGRLGVSYRDRPLDAAVRDAADLLAEREGDRREVYLFTDLSAASWTDASREAIAAQLDRLPGATLYVVDVGANGVANQGLGAVRLSSPLLAAGQPLTIETAAYASGGSPLVAELWIGRDGDLEKRGQTIVDPSGGAGPSRAVSFTVAGLEEGVHQGCVSLSAPDGLDADNRRYFTVRVEPPRAVLLAGADRTSTLFVDQALAPADAVGGEPEVYETERVPLDGLASSSLAGYASVWLLDPRPLETAVWRRLDDYARAGGSVVVALGRNATSTSFNGPAPQALLAAPLKWVSRDATYLRPTRYDHPSLKQMADYAEAIVWSDFPVFRYWALDGLNTGTIVISPFANGDSAMVERAVGRGRVVTITTPLSDPASGFQNRGDPWNLLPTGPDPWPFLALTRNVADYLAGASDQRWNYAAGDAAIVPAPAGVDVSGYVLRLPDGEAIKGSQPGGAEIVIGATDQPGNYRVQAGGERGRLDTGFSVNAAADIGRLERVAFNEVRSGLGADRAQLARGRADLARKVDVGRTGRELYPWLIAIVALALGAEHFVSNRFYETTVG